MTQHTSNHSGTVTCGDTVSTIMNGELPLEEDNFQCLNCKPLDALFDTVMDRVRTVVMNEAKSLKDNQQTSTKSRTRLKQYLHMNRLLLGLQHWATDIQVQNCSPLSFVKQNDDRFNSLETVLRKRFLDIILACPDIDKATEKQGRIDHLDQLSRDLRTFVAPLRIFIEDTLDFSNDNIGGKAVSHLDPDRFGKKRKGRTMRRLQNMISRSLADSTFDTGGARNFAPNGLVRCLIVPENVRASLAKGLSPGQEEVDQDLVDYIVFQAWKLFAICLKLDLGERTLLKAMICFKKNSMSDDDLPLVLTELPHAVPDSDDDDSDGAYQESTGSEDSAFSSTSAKKFDSKLHEIDPKEKIWKHSKRQSFIKNEQWVFLAPVFSTKEDHLDLARSSILPFQIQEEGSNEGDYDIVHRIGIQEGYLDDQEDLFGSSMPSSFAIKQIHPHKSKKDKTVWTRELANLRFVNRLKHPNILRFVTAFRREALTTMSHYLICEWADGGNLRNFWDSHKSPNATLGLVEEVITQLLGLADALFTLHYASSSKGGLVHTNLKPENILHFKPRNGGMGVLGTLKIGDWGLSKEKSSKTPYPTQSSAYRSSTKYEPPETRGGLFVGTRNTLMKKRSRLYDIWSFGCIMLEFVIWLAEGEGGFTVLDRLLGVPGRNQFWEELPGEYLGVHTQFQVRASIVSMMDQLGKCPVCTGTALRDLLQFIRHRALVVHLPECLAALNHEDLRALEPDELARLKAASAELPRSTSHPREKLAHGRSGPSQAQILDLVNPINSSNSENSQAEGAEIAAWKPQKKPTVEALVPDPAPAPTAGLRVVESKGPPRAKATELLKTMRRIMMLAADQAAVTTTGSSTHAYAKRPSSVTSAAETIETTTSTVPSLNCSENTVATSSVEAELDMPRDLAASAEDSSKLPDEVSDLESLGVPSPQNLGDEKTTQ